MEINLNPCSLNYETIHMINQEHKVYLVRNRKNGELCVKKILDIYNEDVYRRLQKLNLPGMPCIMEIWHEGDRLVVIEEYVSGVSLADKIEGSRLTPRDICCCFSDLRDILASLHRQNPPIIHRDIKPSNVIINHRNRVVLLDFNAAKNYDREKERDTVLIGTEGYAAPEQYGFGSSMPQTDIYSLGVVLNEAVSSLREPVRWFDSIIKKCTQLDPVNRYQSTLKFKDDILAVKGTLRWQENKRELSKTYGECEDFDEKYENERVSFEREPFAYPDKSTRLIAEYDNPRDIRYFIPPGFRSLNFLRMIVATAYYLLCTLFAVSYCKDRLLRGNAYAVIESVWVWVSLLNIVFIPCNYGNIQRLMPLCKSTSKIMRYIGIVLLWFVLLFGILLIIILMELIVKI